MMNWNFPVAQFVKSIGKYSKIQRLLNAVSNGKTA
jgi:hypothetical protein